MTLDVEIDTAGNYTIYEKLGELNYRPASSMSFEEYKQYQDRQILKNYWKSRARAQDGESPVSSRGIIPKIYISPVLDRIFGGSYVELVPRGFVTLDFGGQFQKINNPAMPIRQQRNGGFEFDQQINLSVIGKVGEKLQVMANFDNNNSFDFQNNMKVEYTGFKEDILQKLEIGNVSLPLNNTLIQGAQNLFGIKAQLQFGKLNVTTIATTQRGKTSAINLGGGGPGGSGQGRPFELIASQYDENRHFFLSHFFRDNYEKWTQHTPQITSGVNIMRVEVYILNRNNDTQTLRNIVGLMDIGEPVRIYNPGVTSNGAEGAADNQANTLNYIDGLLATASRNVDVINTELSDRGLKSGVDFEKISGARKLNSTEFTFHPYLGYITLTRKLQNDEAIAVAFEYTYRGELYQVGELTEDYATLDRSEDEVVFLKLLRQRNLSTFLKMPTWDLMMKNIYSLGVNQLTNDGFQLRVIYKDDASGTDQPQLQEPVFQDKPLVELFGLDRLNTVNDPFPDGNFDYVEGITVNSANGLIIFPFLEPFGRTLRSKLGDNPVLIRKYAYDTLYRTTKAEAELFATKNKFWLKGFYSSAGGGSAKEIMVPGFGLAQGSVKVFAGGLALMEGTDFVVDYTFGKVTILNDAILNSGKEIQVTYEQNDPFAFQTRSLLGTRFDYRLNDDINFGSTFLYYNERPVISRNQIGTEPARNMQYGLDFNINKQSRMLTKMIDAIPLIQTKEQSTINITGEFAQLIPGTSNVVDGEGTAYIDDFESTATPYSMMHPFSWKLAAVPQTADNIYYGQPGAYPDGAELNKGFRRAKLAWYTIDNQLLRSRGAYLPPNITEEDQKNNYVRIVEFDEIFPQKTVQQVALPEQILDLAYYPQERGPYNYNDKLDGAGKLPLSDIERNWAGITNAIQREVDFDKANIEYIEFWMLDPFLGGRYGLLDEAGNQRPNTKGGKVIFQLGDISEDVIPDGKHAFENGLPTDGNLSSGKVAETPWGYVTTQQYLTNGFDNTQAGARVNQDVGLDGLSSAKEVDKFGDFLNSLSPESRNAVSRDPSADDYRHFLDASYDAANAKILERYKDFNGMENNTPAASNTSDIAYANYQNPDNEDLNGDNTLSGDLETYYEYDIDLRPDKLAVGEEYIVDKRTATNSINGETVTWYLFRIPIRSWERRFGDIQGFKSLRYTRMILTGFSEPVVLRLANFRMVGSRWRRYTESLQEGIQKDPETIIEDVTVSVVSIEENSEADIEGNKSAYQLPPGFLRDRNVAASNSALLNEQSVQMCVDNLEDGDARAMYKNLQEMDLFNYGRLKMFLHANSYSNADELHAFIRLGTDFDQNYYEVEIPLKISKDLSSTDSREVWPELNEIDIAFDELYELKAQRDRTNYPLSDPYPRTPKQVGHHLIRIVGRPDLSAVQVIMIGVRNPSSPDRRPHSVCIWANELRVTDFNRTAGWAVNTTLSAKLADFATITSAFRHTTFGFGSVSSKIFERTREETTVYDIAANINVDKLIPGEHGIKIPMFVGYENTLITPQYDPANPDLKTDIMMRSFDESSPEERRRRDSYLKMIQDRTTRRSLNFTNVRKVKVNPDAKTHIWDIENFAFSYSFSEAVRTSFTTALGLQKTQRGSISYQFSPKATGIEPFKDSQKLNSPWLKFIKDFNFNLMPSNIGVRFDLERSFGKTIYRNSIGNGEFSESRPNYLKYFTFNRQYNLRWDFTRSLSLEYNSRVNAIIDEPYGDIDTKEKRDTVFNNLKKFGRMKYFDQSITANYKLPLDKFPITDWIGADYRHAVTYSWKAGPVNLPGAPVAIPPELDFRNTIQNSRERNFAGRLDLVKLYNKVSFLKEINTPPPPPRTTGARPQQQQQQADTVKKAGIPAVVKNLFKLMMSVKSINGTYSIAEGTILPGFDVTPKFLGMDESWSAPGWKFVLGDQDPDIRKRAARNNWLVKKEELSTLFTQARTENLNLRANVEPARDFKIQIDVKKETQTNFSETWRFDPSNDQNIDNGFGSYTPFRSGTYRVSTISLKTAFEKSNSELESSVFGTFEKNIDIVRERFRIESGGLDYDKAQDVLIPAFIAAYTGKNAASVSLSPFPKNPVPNWRVDYTGLTKVPLFKDLFQSVTISHAYQSIYGVSNYSSSGDFFKNPDADRSKLDMDRRVEDYNRSYFGEIGPDGRLIPVYVISSVVLSEQFNPLIGINVRTKGRVTANLQYKTKRDLALTVSNAQITELNSKDVSFELGFTKNNMKLPFKSQGRTVVLKNDVTFRLNTAIGNTKTIQRKIGEDDQVTNGNINFQLRPNISYTVNQKLMLQMYFERNINEPLISISSRRATTRFGVQIRFSLAQ